MPEGATPDFESSRGGLLLGRGLAWSAALQRPAVGTQEPAVLLCALPPATLTAILPELSRLSNNTVIHRITQDNKMRSHLTRRRRHLTISFALIGIIAALIGTIGILASTAGIPLGVTTACGCEGEVPPEYEGDEAARAIAAGTSKDTSVKFEFNNAGEKETAGCEETYSWAKQGPARTFVLSPSYANCKYKGENATITIGASCRYQLNDPFFVSHDNWVASLSITGTECQIKMELEKGACEVKVASEKANEDLGQVNESTAALNLRVAPGVTPIKYTSKGCKLPVSAGGATLTYVSEEEIDNAAID